ncbi:MAG TPA: hypothetical protein P5114_10740 [Hyphomicrobiaceae bacterium]|nr:hypothetical protein [Hyphomicrobiaceae bacterium]HRY07587.1 hypothetical protein [Hyphomicrobiaceae bacterium]
MKALAILACAVALALAPAGAGAQEAKAPVKKVAAKKAPAKAAKAKPRAVKAGKGEKVCRYRFPSGERRAWVCKKEQPCCAWDAISYVKCGSTITGCL